MKGSFISAILILGFFVGWALNIYQLIKVGLSSELTTMLGLKFVGIFVAPLGSILGWYGVF